MPTVPHQHVLTIWYEHLIGLFWSSQPLYACTFLLHHFGDDVENERKSQIMSKVGNMANGDVKNDGGTDVGFKGVKPTYAEILSRGARNEPG